MSYIDSYLNTLSSFELRESVVNTSNELVDNISTKFDFCEQINCLLLGNVQSGKTGQMLGAISLMADKGYRLFLLLTTDNIDLQRQTYNRVKASLGDFNVISEKEEVLFEQVKLSKPTVIVLKKNTRVLKKWKDILVNTNVCHGLPLVIFDDEADAASLNTKVNANKVSPINRNLSLIKGTSTSSVYVEVTATPQAVLLQSLVSGWRPSFVTYFKPGSQYLGGNFFFSDPTSYCAKFTEDNELDKIIADDDTVTPDGLRDSILTFLAVCAYKKMKGESNCNFMSHPNVNIDVHNKFVTRVQEFLNLLEVSQNEKGYDKALRAIWADLQHTKPDFPYYEDIKEGISEILENTEIMVVPLNSKSFVCRDSTNPDALDLSKGFNIVIGGNTLGRGITFPHLQTVYYCRSAKRMQADTFWQHSRIFGYDREKELVRVFIPRGIYKMFSDLNNANDNLIKQVESGNSHIQLIYPPELTPTRSNVLDNRIINIISGGTNFFASSPIEANLHSIDDILMPYKNQEYSIVDVDETVRILELTGSSDLCDFDNKKFIYCIKALAHKRPTCKCILIVRTERDIAKGTGTLLSPNDRQLGDKHKNDIVLTMYRIKGSKDKGWNGNPIWIPNIKLPGGFCFYDTIEVE